MNTKQGNKKKFNKRTSKGNARQERDKLHDDLSHEKDAGKYQQTEEKLSSLNDVSWYTRYPELTIAAASLPYAKRPGMELPLGVYGSDEISYTTAIPGVCKISWIPSIGYSDSNTSPAATAAKELYARVRSNFSNSLNVDPPDFIIYLMALDSIYSYISMLKRMYKTLNMYSPMNFAVPEALLQAMGLDSAAIGNLRENPNKLWETINTLVRHVNEFVIPDMFDIIHRHSWMNENVYCDAPTPMAQMYLFQQVAFYKFQLDTDGAGMLKSTASPVKAGVTTKELLDFGIELIEALNADDTIYDMNGYLMRAFGESGRYLALSANQNEIISPVYVPEVLSQIENSVSLVPSANGRDITQNPQTNVILHKPSMSSNTFVYPLINIHHDNPTVGDTLVASRLLASVGNIAATTGPYPVICGTEIVTGYTVIRLITAPSAYSTSSVITTSRNFQSYINLTSDSSASELVDLMGMLSSFDWHPMIRVLFTTNGTTKIYKGELFGDMRDRKSVV